MTRTPAALLALLLLAAPVAARAQAPSTSTPAEASTPTPAPSDAPVAAEPAAPPADAGDGLDFDLLGPGPAADVAQAVDPALERRIGRRRTMLKLHQGLGFALAGGLVATTVLGQLQFNDSFRGGGDTRALLPWHRGAVIGTTALFTTVGLLGVLAPTPYPKQGGWDTVRVHKILMTVATVGMLTQAALGIMARERYGQLSEVPFATAHQVVGYATLGAVAGGMTVLFF
jgi:hypothetical protein